MAHNHILPKPFYTLNHVHIVRTCRGDFCHLTKEKKMTSLNKTTVPTAAAKPAFKAISDDVESVLVANDFYRISHL